MKRIVGVEARKKFTEWATDKWKKTFIGNLSIPVENLSKSLAVKQIDLMRKIVYSMSIPPIYGTVTSFHIVNSITGTDVIFALLYGEIRTNISTYPVGSIIEDGVIVKYNCISPSYVSADGEYRTDFTTMQSINILIEMPIFEDILQYSDKHFLRKNMKTFTANHTSTHSISIDRLIHKHNLMGVFLALSLFKTIYQTYRNILDEHINDPFKELFKVGKRDIAFAKTLEKKYGKGFENVWKLLTKTVAVVPRTIAEIGIDNVLEQHLKRFGQKIISINTVEMRHFGDINYPTWREYALSNRVSELVVNNISSGFPLCYSWFFVKSDENLFDNVAQKYRIDNAGRIWDSIRSLHRIQSRLETVKQGSPRVSPDWIFYCIERYKNSIDYPITKGQELILSDMSAVMIGEYVGKVFSYYLDKDPSFLLKEGYERLKKMIFEVTYHMYVLYSRLGILHCDLHLNNVTMRQKPINWTDEYAKFIEVYDIGKYKFSLPATPMSLTIIDFSRSCVMSKYLLELFELNVAIKQLFQSKLNAPKFVEEQTERLVATYLYSFPEMEKYRYNLVNLCKTNESAMFKLLSTHDVYHFVTSIIESIKEDSIKCDEPNKTFLSQCKILLEKFLIQDMNSVIGDINYVKVLKDMEEPLSQFMRTMFPEFIKPIDFSKVVDYYDASQPIKFSLNSYETMPNYVKYTKFYDEYGSEFDIDPRLAKKQKRILIRSEKNVSVHLKHIKSILNVSSPHKHQHVS